jgi:integrase/recombinase XerD
MKIEFSKELANYLSLRESLGIPTFQISPVLAKFVRYLNQHCQAGEIKTEQVLDWVSSGDHSIATQHVRLSAARVFLKYLKSIIPETEIPSCDLIARRRRPEPFVFTDQQVLQLLDEASKLDPKKSLAPMTVQTILGLMACTGLRPGEAMRLKRFQVLLNDPPPRLLISQTKFSKTRWVLLHSTTRDRLREYTDACEQPDVELFFCSKKGKPVNRITLHRIFQELIGKIGIRPRENQLRPTLHSLRHTFTVHRLLHWYSEGADARGLLPNLSVYLGHIDPSSTYWYLTCTPQLMSAAAERFELYGSRGGLGQ